MNLTLDVSHQKTCQNTWKTWRDKFTMIKGISRTCTWGRTPFTCLVRNWRWNTKRLSRFGVCTWKRWCHFTINSSSTVRIASRNLKKFTKIFGKWYTNSQLQSAISTKSKKTMAGPSSSMILSSTTRTNLSTDRKPWSSAAFIIFFAFG